MINSALLSAQNRKRCYWTNIPNVTQPDDLGIMLADVLENGVPWQDKSYCMTASYDGAVLYNTLESKQRTMVAIPVNTVNGKSHTVPATYYKAGTDLFPSFRAENSRQKIAVPINTYNDEGKKSRTVMAGYYKYGEATLIKNKGFKGGATAVAVPIGAAQRGRYNGGYKTEQHIEVRNDGKSNCLTTVQKDTLVCAPVRVGHYGNGGQGQRIYSVRGKSVTLLANGGGQGAKTGLYRIDLPDGDYIFPIEPHHLSDLKRT